MRKLRKAPGANGGQVMTNCSSQVYVAPDVAAQERLAELIDDHKGSLRANAFAVADLIRQRLQADDRPRPLRLGSMRTGPFTLHVADGRVFLDPEVFLSLNGHLVGLLLGLKLELGNMFSVGRPNGGEHA